MQTTDEIRIGDIAMQVALGEMLRILIAETCDVFSSDAADFRNKVNSIRDKSIGGINSRQLFPEANEATEQAIKDGATGYIARLLDSIGPAPDKM
ncbi:hypothetical protein [Mesorhizobium sp. B2-6-4]|uniref:hypothetical protein n=1 Tax=Mesorhizobium sp. B2-6-4 TaxID=2589913 RepID=UPI00112D6ACF|nr:hypothetical protein [Mesorhizobium sp. B2-6-4]TPJ52727.1 hypothetical protein FJ426_15870 [Mesorhizobium sp. B2-6-4]